MSAVAPAGAVNVCRNCGALAPDTFCPSCGQETDTRLPTMRQLMHDATGRLVSFDSRLWRTLFALIAKPGFLTREYLDGRRRRYLRPTRLYLVMSVLLFAALRLEAPPIPFDERTITLDDAEKARVPGVAKPAQEPGVATSPGKAPAAADSNKGGFNLTLDKEYNIVVEGPHYPFSDLLRDRLDRFNRLSRAEKADQISAGMLRYGPYAMFVLLPALAWLQQIAYLGRSRRYPGRPRKYVEHLVYAAHIHTFLFLIAAVALLIDSWVNIFLAPWVLYYVFRAKQVIYRGSKWGGLLRGLFVFVVYDILFCLATIALFSAAILVR